MILISASSAEILTQKILYNLTLWAKFVGCFASGCVHSRGFQNLCKPQIRIFFTYVFFFYKNAWFFNFLAIFSSNLNKNSHLQSKQDFFIHTFMDSNRSSFAGCNQRLPMYTILFVLWYLKKFYISVKNAFALSRIIFLHTAYLSLISYQCGGLVRWLKVGVQHLHYWFQVEWVYSSIQQV